MWILEMVYLAYGEETQATLFITNCFSVQEVLDYMEEAGWDDIRQTSPQVIRTEHDGASYLNARLQ